jgi:hypothetical protein
VPVKLAARPLLALLASVAMESGCTIDEQKAAKAAKKRDLAVADSIGYADLST